MNRTFNRIQERIRTLVYIFAPGLYNASQRTKVIFGVCSVIVVIAPIIFLVRSCSDEGVKPKGYAIQLGPLSQKDQQGNQWTIELLPGQPRLFYSSSKLKPGQPLFVSPNVEFKGTDALIGFEVKGQAGERYSAGVLKNGKMGDAPAFDIIDEGGKVLASGQFMYG